MFRLSEAAVAFAKIDQISDDQTPALDKLLRNLTQRHYLPSSGRDGRADLYSLETICALRLAERLDKLGTERHVLDNFLRFLQSAPLLNARFRKIDGARIALTVIEEAVERARAGEHFELGLTIGTHGHVEPKTWFARDLTEDAKSIIAGAKNAGLLSESDATLRLAASRLIRAVLAELPGE